MLKNSRGKLRKPNGKPLDYVIGDEDEDFNDFPILNHPYQRSTAVYNNLLLALFWFTKLTQGIANKKKH